MEPDDSMSADCEVPREDAEAQTQGGAATSDGGPSASELKEKPRGRSPLGTIATAGLALVIIGVAGVVSYRNLPEELTPARIATALKAAAAQIPAVVARPAVVDDAPDPGDVKTRVVVIDAGKEGAPPVVALARPTGPRKWDDMKGTVPVLLNREMIRQALLIAARDELGLATRDEVLDDVAPEGGRDAGELSTLIRFKGTRTVFRRGEGEQAEVLLKKEIGTNPDGGDYSLRLAALAEAFSRSEFTDLLKRLGLKGEPNKVRADAPVPAGVDEKLERLGLVDNFAAVRALHAAIRADGESPARLAALSRGYAQLDLLTAHHWSPAHQIFGARALLYAERLVARDPKSAWALRNRGFIRALIGFDTFAIDDLDEAKKLDKQAKAPTPLQDWVEMIDAYLHYDLDRLDAKKGRHERLAALLKMTALEFPTGTRVGGQAARDVVKVDPDCDRAYDVVCGNGNLGDLHEMTVQAPLAFGASFPVKLKGLPDLPAAVSAKFNGPADEPTAVAALADAGKPGADQGEPSWGVLAHLAREARFVHVWRRLFFMACQWSVPVDEFWTQAGPWVADHRFLPYLESLVDPRDGLRLFAKFADELDLNDVEITERGLVDTFRQIGHSNYLYAWNASIKHGEGTARHCSAILASTSSNQEMYARVLHNHSPHSPYGMAGLIEHAWDRVKGEVPAWRAESHDAPALLGALGKKYAALKQYKEAEDCLVRYIAKSSDRWAYQWLAGCYQAEGDDDRWKATLDEFLDKTEDAGLEHAKVRVQLANWFMSKEKWAEAKEYAEAAAQTWAGWAMLCAAKANEGLQDWDRAEFWYTQTAERYPSSSTDLLLFQQRMKGVRPDTRPPADEKERLAALASTAASIQSGQSGYIHWLNGSTRKALDDFDAAYRASPRVNLATGLMLVADELGDVAQRDAALEDLCTKLKDQAPKTCAICQLFRDSLANDGKTPLDLAAVDKILETIPSNTRGNSEFIVGKFLLNRGRSDEGRKHLQRCAESTNGYEWTRTIAATLIRAPEKN